MNKVRMAFFSFTEVTDPKRHRDYNVWHQLDHRPENLALPGVSYGERWVSPPEYFGARLVSDSSIHPFHYMNMYHFLEPVEQTMRDFRDLGRTTLAIGRRPEIPYSNRITGGTFLFCKAYAAPRVLISPEAIPFRPTRGVFVTVGDIIDQTEGSAPVTGTMGQPAGAQSASVQRMLEWYDQVHFPDMLTVKGVAGVWAFISEPSYLSDAFAHDNPPGRMVHVYYLDEDPLEMVADLKAKRPQWKKDGRLPDFSKVRKSLFAGPLKTIVPWEWDWFD